MLSWKIVKASMHSSKAEITALFISAALLILVYNLHLNTLVIIYPVVLTLTVMAVYIFLKAFKISSFYKQLEESLLTTPEKITEQHIIQEQVLETIRNIHKRHLKDNHQLSAQIETRNALFSQFIHGMKTSVAVISLACEKMGGDTKKNAEIALSDISSENEKLRKNLEQALSLLRLDTFVNDYMPEKVDLVELLTHTINEHKRDFIYHGIYPKIKGSGIVYTDHKWCAQLISQFISNAIKYTEKEGHVIFEIKQVDTSTKLYIIDNGIGIPSQDLPRIFDLFFTGTNGRKRDESTGIGLFMAQRIAESLSITLDIDSKAAVGTTVILTFSSPNLTKM